MLNLKPKFSEQNYGRCLERSKRVSWDIHKDVIRDRSLDNSKKFLPDSLTGVSTLDFLNIEDQILFSHIQGRTYANMIGLVEKFIERKIGGLQPRHLSTNKLAHESLARFCEEEQKHQALFENIDALAKAVMPEGYQFIANPDDIADFVLSKSTWSVLALTCVIELFTQSHYQHSIESAEDLCPLYKDVFMFHWKEESQHAILDEMEWRQHDTRMAFPSRDAAVTDFTCLLTAIDEVLQLQASSDTQYFLKVCGHSFYEENQLKVYNRLVEAYRYQYILSGAKLPRFQKILSDLLIPQQLDRVFSALSKFEPEFSASPWAIPLVA